MRRLSLGREADYGSFRAEGRKACGEIAKDLPRIQSNIKNLGTLRACTRVLTRLLSQTSMSVVEEAESSHDCHLLPYSTEWHIKPSSQAYMYIYLPLPSRRM